VRLGRRPVIITAALVFTVGALAAAVSPDVWTLVASRFVLGLAVGSAALVVPLYLSEIAPTNIRGAISSLNQMMIVAGILTAFIVNAALASSGNWRLMVGAAVIPSLILLVGMAFMPETPRFLVRKGQEDEAREVLEELRSDDEPEQELREILRAHDPDQRRLRGRVRDLREPRHRCRQRRDDDHRDPDRRSRRPQADAARRPGRHGLELDGAGRIPAPARRAEVAGRPRGDHHADLPRQLHRLVREDVGPVVWVMLPEVLPLSVRGTAMGVAIFLHWLANFAVSQTFPLLLKGLGPGPVFLGYAFVGVLAFLFVQTQLTETKGRSLEEIEADLLPAGSGDGGRFTRKPESDRTPARSRS
jgi:MFS family permease